ncbi:MAG: hypothetical protein IIA44_12765 [Acidobacteria bacterium]|nr:hypothetical protein [Acidobacteriota bacterium]
MATFSGKDGTVLSGSTTLADITHWRLKTIAQNVAYASSATSGHRKRLPGVKDAGGSFTFRLNASDAVTAELDVGDLVTLKLYVDATNFFSVPAIVDAVEVETDISTGKVVGGAVEFSADGAWTEPSFGS